MGTGPRPEELEGEAGTLSVQLARRTLEEGLTVPIEQAVRRVARPASSSSPLLLERGVFVTLEQHPSGRLRGCVGFPTPSAPLHQSVPLAALYAAREDPRFPPVRPSELPDLRIEVSLLTVPTLVPGGNPEEVLSQVRIGRDGLVLRAEGVEGLLLPQVAPEQGWGPEEFLDGVCEKAGLAPGCWREPGARIYRFQARIFRETEPRGSVRERSPESD